MCSMIRKAIATGLLALVVSASVPSTASATDYSSFLFSDDVLYCDDRVVSGTGNWNLTFFCGGWPTGYLLQNPGPGNHCSNQETGWCWGGYGAWSDHAIMQLDGNFVAYNGSTPIWDTGTYGYWGSYLNTQDDSNIVVYTYTDVPIWSIW
jgi:hypothetical protein